MLTNASASVHNLARHPGRDNLPERHTFDELESELLEWMGNFNYTAEIFHMPFGTAALCPELFVLPAAADLFPLLDTDLRRATDLARLMGAAPSEADSATQLDFAALPPELQGGNSIGSLGMFIGPLFGPIFRPLFRTAFNGE